MACCEVTEHRNTGKLVTIWSTESGRKSRVAVALRGTPAYFGLRLYDVGDGKTRTSDYKIGAGPSRARVFEETPEALCAAFREAGLPQPTVIRVARIAYSYRAAHAFYRGTEAFMNFLHSRARAKASVERKALNQ